MYIQIVLIENIFSFITSKHVFFSQTYILDEQ